MELSRSHTSEISGTMATELMKLFHEVVKEIRSELISQVKEEMINIIKWLLNVSKEHLDKKWSYIIMRKTLKEK